VSSPKLKIASKGDHCTDKGNNPMAFQFNNIYYRHLNIKSYMIRNKYLHNADDGGQATGE